MIQFHSTKIRLYKMWDCKIISKLEVNVCAVPGNGSCIAFQVGGNADRRNDGIEFVAVR
jgi:hypothetical protein